MVNISHNNTSTEEETTTDPASFEDFEEHFNKNPDLTNVDLYSAFPNVNKSTLRSWKKKVLDSKQQAQGQTTSSPTAQQQNDQFYKDQVETLKALLKGRFNAQLIESLPMQYQLQQLQILAKQIASNPDPNMSLIPVPAGSGKRKLGIEQYLKMDEKSFKDKGFGNIELIIPASTFQNPKKVDEFTQYI